ncbi:MAG: Coenzyme F420 hydrogenase/dehydrogenase, beta subunit C-terminal domain, partial [Bacillota bacterium]
MIKPEAKTIQEIVKANLCTACGTCAGICPQSAIDLVVDNKRGIYVPKIYPNKCSLCGTCIACCPGGSLNVDHLNLEIFGVQPDNVLVGNHANCYTGHSTSHEIRYSSSSGGLITELLIFALKNKLIDGVIVTKMNASDPLRPEPFLAKTKEEIVSASKSKYCPIPVNTMLKEILKTEGRFAVVGLPCHIHGIRKAMKVNKKLSERIVLIFGLMCSFNRNFLATEFILQRLSIKKEEIIQLDYRGKGYMGNLSVSLRNGQVFSVPYLEYNQWLRSFFSITRCFLCIDHTCEFADISFGDNCLPQFRKESIGSSILISRTQRGEQLLASARTADRI